MASSQLPDALLVRFRTLSLERIGRVESTWQALVQGLEEVDAADTLLRDLHSVKGDARVVEYDDVHVLCQKLEDLVTAAIELEFQVSEDLDVVVTMAIQFAIVLLRRSSRESMGGLDLDGFVRQVDEVLQLVRAGPARRTPARQRRESTPPEHVDRLSESSRRRLAVAATAVFAEHLAAVDPARARLGRVWRRLRDELARIQSVELGPLLARQLGPAEKLAGELGKKVAIVAELDPLPTRPAVAEALDLAVLHLLRNAIDHGLEPPADRRRAGKPETATIELRGRRGQDTIELEITDDGAGVDLDVVRARALEHGLIDRDRAAEISEAELVELLFHPGFSTRSEVSEISGRGVGLDAVRAAISRLGGSVEIRGRAGGGTAVRISVPVSRRQIRVYQFAGPRGQRLAVPDGWAPFVQPASDAAIDPLAALLELPPQPGDRAIRFSWGFLEVLVAASSSPELAVGDRICATAEDHAVEVIAVDQVDVLLLRPERF